MNEKMSKLELERVKSKHKEMSENQINAAYARAQEKCNNNKRSNPPKKYFDKRFEAELKKEG